MFRAVVRLLRCVHKAGLVWTDLKLDNMLLCQRDEARAIDLEGAVPARSAPKSYTPDTMPPDFAVASRGGVSLFFLSVTGMHKTCTIQTILWEMCGKRPIFSDAGAIST